MSEIPKQLLTCEFCYRWLGAWHRNEDCPRTAQSQSTKQESKVDETNNKSLQEHIENMDDPLDTNRQKQLRDEQRALDSIKEKLTDIAMTDLNWRGIIYYEEVLKHLMHLLDDEKDEVRQKWLRGKK